MKKHNFLRRLSALALALVLTASLCAVPAWADDPAPSDLEFNTRVIVLKDSSSSSSLTIRGASIGERIELSAPGNVTLDNRSFEITEDQPDVTVLVGTSISSTERLEATITVSRYDAESHPIGSTTCYVYCNASPLQTQPTIGPATVGTPLKVTVTVTNATVAGVLKDGDITISSGRPDIATAEISCDNPNSGGNRYTATINPLRALSSETVPINIFLRGVLVQSWDLAINPAPDTELVTGIAFRPNFFELANGETLNAQKPIITPADATNSDVTWSSSRTDVATVDATGKVTATGAGTAIITATAADGSGTTGTYTVTVKEAESTVTLDKASMVLNLDGGPITGTLTATPFGANSGTATVAWTSSNRTIATVDASGTTVTVTGLKAGSATITATATFTATVNGRVTTTRKTATCAVTVLDSGSIPVTSLTLSEQTKTIAEDGSFQLSVKSVTPANAPAKGVTWSTNDPEEKILKVDQKGNVTAVGPGSAIVTATADFGGAYDFCVVTVTQKSESIRLSFDFDSNTQGTNKYTYTFRNTSTNYIVVNAVLEPTGTYAAADPVHWASKNTAVATVTTGTSARATVTAVAPGRTTITAVPMDPKGKDREIDPAEVTVTVSGIGLDRTTLTVVQGQRETLEATAYGSANSGDSSCEWTSSDPAIASVGTKNGATTTITARKAGTVIITARKGNYSAECTVTVTEDSLGLIDGISTTPGTAYEFSKLVSRLQSACSQKTGSALAYITNLAVSSTDQGILHDQHHSSDDTGAGVGLQDKYYPGTAPQGERSINDLSFVPKNTFTGTAEISYTAWSSNNQSMSGVIRIAVNGTGDVMYASGEGGPVTFSADDFNFYHPNVKSVSFTLPLDTVGTLYYDYTSASQPGTRITAGTAYSRTGAPSLDRVTFVPAAGYSGTAKINYQGTDTSGRSFTGTVTITVGKPAAASNPADIYYSFKDDGWVTFAPANFNTASQAVLGEPLSYVRFTLPASSKGTLFYNYRGFGNYDSAVASTTSYYYSGTPALSGVSFVPTTTTPTQVEITYTGYSTKGNTFTGTIHIGEDSTTVQQTGLRYTVTTGGTLRLSTSDLNTVCIAATGASLASIQFTTLPTVSQGYLRYTRGTSSTPYDVTTGTRFYYTGTGTTTNLIGNVYFQAGATTGTVVIPFTGYNTNNVSFTDKITIQVTPPTTTYSGTTAGPFRLSSAQMRSAVGTALSGTLSYITFTSLPSATAGRLMSGYSGFGTGSQVNTGVRYYVSGSPNIDQLSFVPRGRYNGQVTIGYTATNTTGQSVSGQLIFNISSTGTSSHFSDLRYHTWAAPSVDYLYENGVTKGITATTYGPDQQILRGDFVLMLVRAFGFTGSNGYSFADVSTGEYFSQAVAIAKQRGIVNGDGGYFRPYSPITRQDAMVIINNALTAAGWNLGSGSTSILNTFSDSGSVSSYARNAVSTLVQLGAVTGDNGRLLPHNSITRAEAAVILHFVMTM